MPWSGDQPSTFTGKVRCHSGFEYAQSPVAFSWEGKRLAVTQIDGEWKTPEGKFFRVRTEGDQVFELLYNPMVDKWSIKET